MATLNESHATAHHHPEEPLRTYWIVFASLMILLILTFVAALFDLDQFMTGLNAVVALTIAVIKASLVILFFMHVKQASKLTWIFATATVLWLALMMVFTFNDYLTRPSLAGPTRLPGDQAIQAHIEDEGGPALIHAVSKHAH